MLVPKVFNKNRSFVLTFKKCRLKGTQHIPEMILVGKDDWKGR